MSKLQMHEKVIFERLFDKNGYVLDFTDRKFAEFFREHGINIEEEKYQFNGKSKMKRLRAFWEIEHDSIVGKVLASLLEYACIVEDIKSDEKLKATKIIHKLQGKHQTYTNNQITEDEFLRQEFQDISIHKLNLNSIITEVIEQRIKEIKKCLKAESPLATIFLCGSTLEGILLGIALNNPTLFNSANSSPKDKNGKILKFQNWTLSNFIDVAKEIGFLEEDVKQFCHALRHFRNYIHPHQQAIQKFNPSENTDKICFQVLKAAIHQITQKKL